MNPNPTYPWVSREGSHWSPSFKKGWDATEIRFDFDSMISFLRDEPTKNVGRPEGPGPFFGARLVKTESSSQIESFSVKSDRVRSSH